MKKVLGNKGGMHLKRLGTTGLAQKNREPTNTSTNYCSLINHKTLSTSGVASL